MGGGGCICIYTHIVKADLPANDGASPIVSQNVKAAAGAHAHDGRLSRRKVCQGLDPLVEAAHQLPDLGFLSEHGGNGLRIGANALHHAGLCICRQVYHRSNLAEAVVS